MPLETLVRSLEADQLCDKCAAIFSKDAFQWWDDWGLTHATVRDDDGDNTDDFPGRAHTSWEDLDSAAAAGCALCIAQQVFLRSSRFWNQPPTYVFKRDRYQIESHFVLQLQRSVSLRLQKQQDGRSFRSLGNIARTEASTGATTVAELGKSWLSECLQKHHRCAKTQIKDWWPTRVLDVSGTSIRLVECSEHNLTGSYATLSHCWGIERFPVLTPDTLTSFRRGVSLDSFPPSFRETMITVQRLGLNYCWIDCFCILQGPSAEAQVDWAREASRMQQVYENSLVNIGAAHASNPYGGLFHDRDPSLMSVPESIIVRWQPTTKEKEAFYEIRTPINSSGLQQDFTNHLVESPLFTRAWVLQECVLSPRMLTFGHQQIFWQCSEFAACERHPDGTLAQYLNAFQDPFWLFDQHAKNVEYETYLRFAPNVPSNVVFPRLQHPYHRKRYKKWFEFLARYYNRGLTYPEKDVLMALDGIGSRYAQILQDAFKHGLLVQTMPHVLLWRSEAQHRNSVIPTWHWGATYGQKEAYPILPTDVHLNGSMVHTFMDDNCRLTSPESAKDFWPSLFCFGRPIPAYCTCLTGRQPILTTMMGRVELHIWQDSCVNFEESGHYILLPVFMKHNRFTNEILVDGLVLHGKPDKWYFRRVGTFTEARDTLLEDLLKSRARLVMLI